MQMNQENETAQMPANDDHPQLTGAGPVKVVIVALLLLLIGGKFGVTVSVLHFAGAIVLAAILYFLWRGLLQHLSNRKR
jgi:hypothetical protein